MLFGVDAADAVSEKGACHGGTSIGWLGGIWVITGVVSEADASHYAGGALRRVCLVAATGLIAQQAVAQWLLAAANAFHVHKWLARWRLQSWCS